MSAIQDRLAEGLKQLRRQRQWSLDRAATETGVSKAMLGQIERGESSPTLNTLWKIARGYELSFSQLMAPVTGPETIKETLEPSGSDLRVRPLVPYDKSMRTELLDMELLPGCYRESDPHERGVIEHVIVIQGRMSVLSGGKWHPLGPGDVFRFEADTAHGYRNDAEDQSAFFHNLIHYPQGRAD